MARLCSRPGCSAPAAVTFNFDGLNRIVWLNGLPESPTFTAGDLCWRHAERLQPPRNWEVRDRRTVRVMPPGTAAPSRHQPPASRPGRSPTRPNRSPSRPAAARRHAKPEPVGAVDAPARTPLLSRAFRGVGGA
jgi:Protein of unknown function (DUF3499)